jgi:hypothetical protein
MNLDLAEALVTDLRKGADNSVPDEAWQVIKQELIEADDWESLSGTSGMIVADILRKHGKHDQSSHGRKGGSRTSNQAASRSEPWLTDEMGTGNTSDPKQIEARRVADEKSKKQIKGAKGKGLQPADGSGELWSKHTIGQGNASLMEMSKHGEVMIETRLRGGTPRVKTHNGATASIKGWKHLDDVASGDVIALPGDYGKKPTYKITGVQGDGPSRKWSAIPIGKKGKPTGNPLELNMADLGAGDQAITIVRPREVS